MGKRRKKALVLEGLCPYALKIETTKVATLIINASQWLICL
jgi:hypothetical protein